MILPRYAFVDSLPPMPLPSKSYASRRQRHAANDAIAADAPRAMATVCLRRAGATPMRRRPRVSRDIGVCFAQ
jgi:hypothetical protein